MNPLRFLRLLPGGQLARNTYYATLWLSLRVAGQAVWMIVLARILGPSGYGLFAGTAGLATALGTLTGLGFGVLMLQDASRDRSQFDESWMRALIISLGSGIGLCATYILFAPHILSNHGSLLLYLTIGLTELICFPITVTSSYAFQAHERMGWAGALHTLVPVGNIIAVCVFYFSSSQHLLIDYLPFHATFAALTAASSVTLVHTQLKPIKKHLALHGKDIREGLGFSAIRLADTGLVSLDKTLVLELAGGSAAGIYSSAYRLISVFTLPIISLSMSALPRLFRTGAKDENATLRLIRKSVIVVTVYGLAAGACIWLISDVLPMLLGDAFRPAIRVARWLALYPLLQGLYIMSADLLLTSNMRGLRIACQAIGLSILSASGYLLLPKYGLNGAVAMLLATQVGTVLIMWLCFTIARRSRTL